MKPEDPKKDLERTDENTYEKDSEELTRRKLGGLYGKLTSFIAIAFTVFIIYDQQAASMNPLPLRALVLAVTSLLAFFYYPGWKKAGKKVNLIDVILSLMSIAVFVYVLLEQNTMIYRAGVTPSKMDIVFGTMLLIVTLEMGRRAVGNILPGFAVITLIYAMWGGGLPGILSHIGYTYNRAASFIFGLDGVYGTTLGVIPTYVVSFTLFGCFLQVCGAADMILDLSMAVTGKFRGGLAKVSILASALMGTISGSTVANVSACGTITIPQMKKSNYSPIFSAGVVTAAASGGQIMPPVMGAAAFIMAEILGISYGTVCIAAALPAILYYISIFWLVDLEAQKTNLKGLAPDEVVSIRYVLKTKGHLLIPIIVLLFILIGLKMSPDMAALLATVTIIPISWIRKETRIDYKKLLTALKQTGDGLIVTTAACAVAGIIIGVLGLTGLGVRLGIGLLSYTNNLLFPTMFFTMILAILLGMGQPSISAYIVSSAVAAPSMIELGVSPLTAHLFCFYFATFSNVTPPVAVASYIAAGIAKANSVQVAFSGLKYSLAAFIVPYLFVISPGLLLEGSIFEITIASVFCIIGIMALGSSVQNWFIYKTSWWERVVLFICSLMLLHPEIISSLISIVLIGAIFIKQMKTKKTVSLT